LHIFKWVRRTPHHQHVTGTIMTSIKMLAPLGALLLAQNALAVELPATLEPAATARLYVKASETITAITYDVGDRVVRGDLLLTLDTRAIAARLAQAEAGLKSAGANIGQIEVQLAQARRDRERIAQLAQKGSAATQKLEEIEMQLAGLEAGLKAAQAGRDQAEAAVAEAKIALEQSKLVAPFDGVISERVRDVGDMSEAMKPLITVLKIRPLKAVAHPPAAAFALWKPKTPVVIRAQGQTLSGTITRRAPNVDPATRTFTVEIELPEAPEGVIPGLFATVELAPAAGE